MEKTRDFLRRLAKKVFEHNEYYIFVNRSPDDLPPERPLPAGLRIVRIDQRNANELERIEGLPANKRRDFRRMLAQGQVGYFALDGQRAAGHLWAIIPREKAVNRGYVRVYPGEAYAHYAHTYPPYRRQGIAFALSLHFLHDVLSMPDVRVVKASVLTTNTPSLAMMEALQGRRVGRISHWRVLGIHYRKVLLESGQEQGARW
ncbi:MAG: GNAT family N-acetyltransferase [Anaerolineae bacterium]